jgi:hypothetical protein
MDGPHRSGRPSSEGAPAGGGAGRGWRREAPEPSEDRVHGSANPGVPPKRPSGGPAEPTNLVKNPIKRAADTTDHSERSVGGAANATDGPVHGACHGPDAGGRVVHFALDSAECPLDGARGLREESGGALTGAWELASRGLSGGSGAVHHTLESVSGLDGRSVDGRSPGLRSLDARRLDRRRGFDGSRGLDGSNFDRRSLHRRSLRRRSLDSRRIHGWSAHR